MKIAVVQSGISETTGETILILSKEEGIQLAEAVEFAAKNQPRKKKLASFAKQIADELCCF